MLIIGNGSRFGSVQELWLCFQTVAMLFETRSLENLLKLVSYFVCWFLVGLFCCFWLLVFGWLVGFLLCFVFNSFYFPCEFNPTQERDFTVCSVLGYLCPSQQGDQLVYF